MPADLDHLFQTLGREADAVPLAGPDHARRRGRRRSRIRAGVSVAAGIVLVVAGFGVLRQPDHRAAPPADNSRSGPVPEVGSPITPGGRIVSGIAARDDERVYAAVTRYDDNSIHLIAADLHTGAAAWPAQPVATPEWAVDRVVVTPRSVVVVTRADDGTLPPLALHAFDPATGAPLWGRTGDDGDSAVFTGSALIHVSASGRRIWGVDWRTGAPRWSVTPGGGRPVRALGVTRPADEERVTRSGPAPVVTDPRFVLVTASGQAEVRDAGTGRLQRVLAVPAVSAETAVAYGGWLFAHEEPGDAAGTVRIRATDLAGKRGSSFVVETAGSLVSLGGCGPDRVCAVTRHDGDHRTLVTAIDVRDGRQVWQATSRYGGDEISSARGRTLLAAADGGWELFDAAGRRVFDSVLDGGWLDAGTLLVHAPDGTARLSRWTVADRRLRPLGDGPRHTVGPCTSSPGRLACPTPAGLQIFDVR